MRARRRIAPTGRFAYIFGVGPGSCGPGREGNGTMQTILVSCLVAVVIAVGAAVVLDRVNRPAEVAFATTSVRN